MIMLSQSLALTITLCTSHVCSAHTHSLRLTNDTDTPLLFTLVTGNKETDRWVGPREMTDIYVTCDENERVLITRIGGSTKKELLASPTKVVGVRAFRTDRQEAGVIIAYVGGDVTNGFKTGFVRLGPGKLVPYADDPEGKAEFDETIDSVKASLKRCKGIWPTDNNTY